MHMLQLVYLFHGQTLFSRLMIPSMSPSSQIESLPSPHPRRRLRRLRIQEARYHQLSPSPYNSSLSSDNTLSRTTIQTL